MLTPEEVTKLNHLIEGRRVAEDGMERHFLCVISGEALPCSPKEQEWYQHWQQALSTESENYRSKYEKVATLLSEREETIRILEKNIAGLERDLKRLGSVLQQKDQSIGTLTKEISRLEGWLKNAHETLNKYEPIRKIQEPVRETEESDKWRTCRACGRPIDFCRCSG